MPDQIGSHAWVVQASDGRGGQAQQGFTASVTAPTAQDQPLFTSETSPSNRFGWSFCLSAARATVAVQLPVASWTADGAATARFSLLNGPEGATIDAITGRVEWDPREQGISLGVRGAFNFPNHWESRADIVVPSNASLNTNSFTAEGWYRFDALDGIVSLFKKEHSGVPSVAVRMRLGICRAFSERYASRSMTLRVLSICDWIRSG